MKTEQKLQIKYDRANTRYNRLWEQITNIGLFILATITGYLLALGSIEKEIETVLTLEQVNYVLLGITVVWGIIAAIFSTYLVLTRNELSKIFSAFDIE